MEWMTSLTRLKWPRSHLPSTSRLCPGARYASLKVPNLRMQISGAARQPVPNKEPLDG
jgi:hypothetical protein